eukprot:CAMPEP_0118904974 /NCGR_PEP_ID=MMETSP1166-20130328/9216_1 /TAXON_ID=1104430 /ORGANISM="Chrysoreinhardia sp, Strain CCMP3193" /LENGTH=516 /DNA_ID=CAMNT_0006844243 /DNA_START=8 /DNA_END=1558 /DNA_ORIENTATION=+
MSGSSSSELEALRRQLQEEEEANEIVSLRAELAKVKKEMDSNKKGPESSPKKKKQRTGKEKKVGRAKSALASLPVATAATVRPPNRFQALAGGDDDDDDDDALGGGEDQKKGIEKPKKETPLDARWLPLCEATMACPRFAESLKKEQDPSWRRARPCGEWCKDLPHCYGLDCEMCVCEDPLTKKRTNRELVRLSMVDGSDRMLSLSAAEKAGKDDVVLDTLVKPLLPVVDYVTWIHGIDEPSLRNVHFHQKHAQAALELVVCSRCVLVGHALHNDLASLKFNHDLLVDTSALFTVAAAPSPAALASATTGGVVPPPQQQQQTPALRDVAEAVLPSAAKLDLVRRAHDSTVDARSALLGAFFLLDKAEAVALPYPVPRSSSVAENGHGRASDAQLLVNKKCQLFVHRIPADFDADAVRRAFERTSAVAVDAVANFQPGQPYAKLTLVFRSPQHADLAFTALGDKFDDDKSGRPQKKLFLVQAAAGHKKKLIQAGLPLATDDVSASVKHGPYCKVRQL